VNLDDAVFFFNRKVDNETLGDGITRRFRLFRPPQVAVTMKKMKQLTRMATNGLDTNGYVSVSDELSQFLSGGTKMFRHETGTC